jgi:hypothetical protein
MNGIPANRSFHWDKIVRTGGSAILAGTQSRAGLRSGAAWLALAIVLLPTLCSAHTITAPPAGGVRPVDLPCHDSAPANPELPGSQQKCCAATHEPAALLSSVDLTSALTATDSRLYPLFYSPHPSGSPRHVLAVMSGTDGPLSLRI